MAFFIGRYMNDKVGGRSAKTKENRERTPSAYLCDRPPSRTLTERSSDVFGERPVSVVNL